MLLLITGHSLVSAVVTQSLSGHSSISGQCWFHPVVSAGVEIHGSKLLLLSLRAGSKIIFVVANF